MTSESNPSPETTRAPEAFAAAGAEITVEALRARRWMFPVFGAVFGLGFPIIGIAVMAYHASLETTLFGLALIAAGVFAGRAMLDVHRRVNAFLAAYDEKRRG